MRKGSQSHFGTNGRAWGRFADGYPEREGEGRLEKGLVMLASFVKNSFPLGSISLQPIMFSPLLPWPKDNTFYEKCFFMPDVIVFFFFFFCHVPENLLSGLSVFVCAFAVLIIHSSRQKYDVLRCVILRVKLETQQANLPVVYFSKSTLQPREWVLSGKEGQQEECVCG